MDAEKKETEEKLKALGPLTLSVTLTDFLKSPPPLPSTDQRSQVAMYFESFCESLEVGEPSFSSFFLDKLNQQNMTMTNLDSGQITAMDHPVWDMDANQWLDELMADLEEPSPPDTVDSMMCDGDVTDWLDELMADLEEGPCSLENTVDVENLIHDTTPEDWGHVLNDVLDQLDCDLLS